MILSCQASFSDYSKPNKSIDRVVDSWDGFLLYLLIGDEASRYIWVFLTKSKEPPLDIIDTFLARFGHRNGGSIRSDQGGELARLFAHSDLIPRNINMSWNPRARTAHPKTGRWKFTTQNWQCVLIRSSLVPAYLQSTGRPHWYTRFTCTTGWSIR